MSKLVDSSTWQYERFVIAYPDEKTLRTGHCIPMNVALPQRSEVASVDANRKSLEESNAPKQQSTGRCGLAWTPNSIRNVLQYSVASAIIFFYSRNILSAIFRAFVSF
jgi:hypothetical protein